MCIGGARVFLVECGCFGSVEGCGRVSCLVGL